MYEKFELSRDVIEKYGLDEKSTAIAAIVNKESNILLIEFVVHYSLLPDREFVLIRQNIEYPIVSRVESYRPLIIRLSSHLEGTLDTNEYGYATIIKNSVSAYNRLYQPNDARYCVSLTNSAKPKPKSEVHTLDKIINALCLHARQSSISHAELSKKLLSQISTHGYDREDMEKFIGSGEYINKLSADGKKFISFWCSQGKYIKGQYIGMKPLIIFNFFDFDKNLDN